MKGQESAGAVPPALRWAFHIFSSAVGISTLFKFWLQYA